MPRTFIPTNKHFDVLEQATESERAARRSYSYHGVVKEEVWDLAFRVGEVVHDRETGQSGTIIAATNRQVIAVSSPGG